MEFADQITKAVAQLQTLFDLPLRYTIISLQNDMILRRWPAENHPYVCWKWRHNDTIWFVGENPAANNRSIPEIYVDISKIHVVGTSGSGKSWIAAQIGAAAQDSDELVPACHSEPQFIIEAISAIRNSGASVICGYCDSFDPQGQHILLPVEFAKKFGAVR